ncbi:class 1 isoprenoid biosynthesis enzyme [uncultured Clostridium sp.]|uniref:class 1 isoprenoid biosynthesis enzyme n=1 Tax=uncultured Clostridium sp. TaxID=59620 RepID=UPI0028EF7F88|nr:class 1 isoprenoid biosynthesis enzyme [uncultured Clostridium sp.]
MNDKKNIDYLINLYRDIWWNSSTELRLNIEATTCFEKNKNEKNFDRFINLMISHIKSFPKKDKERLKWKEKADNYIENIILKEDAFKLGVIDKEMKSRFFKVTKEFIKECKSFDSNLNYKDIGQAMRNVWIISIFQKVIDSDIEFTNAIFGYSMLYPYTDNYLDDSSISMEEKKNFNDRFSKRLKGEKIKGINSHEEKVYKLVEYIESVFKRENYKEVYEKLLLIHDGQVKSLTQQEVLSAPYEKDILGISIEKGGASVLVDGYLINGALTKDEEIFAYGYGFLLQLCDDLQDVGRDLENNHMTIMSQLAEKYPLDMITNKLMNLTISIIDDENCFKGSNKEELKELIKNNCIIMILFAIAHNKNFFSKEYVKVIEIFLPFTLSYIDDLKTNLETKFKTLEPSYNDTSIEDILLYLLD